MLALDQAVPALIGMRGRVRRHIGMICAEPSDEITNGAAK